ncbi:MAG TPA: exodeoxyribonuclease I [Candidatus Saccharimonadales bacterium]|nr:exodeoxyribonuclease I [Candidatus Saccharimonadales bacterium]
MADSLFFYDLETSGVNPRESRIMQFAGRRTDMDLNPVGEPINVLIKMTEDTLPEPDAVMVHGTTPQKTLAEGISEAEFIKLFDKEIWKPDTIFAGFNNIRFDDEFMRFLFYRNFNDAYEWQWRDNCSRWDLLDVTRMTRALRPQGIKWPFAPDGKPSNRLELLTAVNKLDHFDAHDALSDVDATIAVAKLIKEKQPKLFDFLLNLRSKKAVQNLVEKNKMFVYSSGKYPAEFEKTTVAARICPHPDRNGALVYDLRHDPEEFINLKPEELVEKWKYKKDSEELRLPVKSLQYNRCPAIAPLGVLDEASKKRIGIDIKTAEKHLATLKKSEKFKDNLLQAVSIINAGREAQVELVDNPIDVDKRLYDAFIPPADKNLSAELRSAEPSEISAFKNKFFDRRLKSLVVFYKARNFPKYLSDIERKEWEDYRKTILLAGGKESSRLARYLARLQELSSQPNLGKENQYLLEELQLWAENIAADMD